MKNFSVKYIVLMMLLLLVSCAVPPKETPESILQQVKDSTGILPGAIISVDGSVISYPDDNLFTSGAVLPWPGGMEVLDPLIELLLKNRKVLGAGVVRSSGHTAEYDQQLAEKRKELLDRIFTNRGLTSEQFQLVVEVGEGAPFEVTLQPIIPATSDGVKR